MAESNLSETAKSWVGARGIMQLMPSTFQEIQPKNPEMTAINDAELEYRRRDLLQPSALESVDRAVRHRQPLSVYLRLL
jgi:hypothetical protein